MFVLTDIIQILINVQQINTPETTKKNYFILETMVINNALFDTYKIKKKSNLLYDIDNTLSSNYQISFRIINNNDHIFIEMSYQCFKELNYVCIGNCPINVDYYRCNIYITKSSKILTICGIVISKYDLKFVNSNIIDTKIIIGFNKSCSFYDECFKIYCLCKCRTSYMILPLFVNGKNSTNKSEILFVINELELINQNIEKEIMKISKKYHKVIPFKYKCLERYESNKNDKDVYKSLFGWNNYKFNEISNLDFNSPSYIDSIIISHK